MKQVVARTLGALNNEFYRCNAASFSATREAPWPGWRRVLKNLTPVDETKPLALFDVACGNLRFERFLAAEYPDSFTALAVDCCDELAQTALQEHDFGRGKVTFKHKDLVEELFRQAANHHDRNIKYETKKSSNQSVEQVLEKKISGTQDSVSLFGDARYDATVCFGFMHHIPGIDNRIAFLKALVSSVCPGGIVAVSLWRFAEDEAGCAKARKVDARARAELPLLGWPISADDLEQGDHFLGWNNRTGTWRYCHSFADEEIQTLCDAVLDKASVAERFLSDGKTGAMNAYLIFQRI